MAYIEVGEPRDNAHKEEKFIAIPPIKKKSKKQKEEAVVAVVAVEIQGDLDFDDNIYQEVDVDVDFDGMNDYELEANIEANIVLDLAVDVVGWVTTTENQKCYWKGYYVQNSEKNDMDFENLQISIQGNIIGSGDDANGFFTIEGQLNHDNTFMFNKNYSAGYTVIYEGTMDGIKMKGLWSLPDQDKEEFEIRMKAREWKGWHKQNDDKSDMDLDMCLNNGAIFGSGHDVVGAFVIRGNFNRATTDFNFVKQYIGQHKVLYFGKATGNKGDLVVRGKWAIDESIGGKFRLKQKD